MYMLKQSNITKSLLANAAMKAILHSIPIDYTALKDVVKATFDASVIDKLIEDGLRFNVEANTTVSRAVAKTESKPLPIEVKQEIKQKYEKQRDEQKKVFKETVKEIVTDYKKLYDSWLTNDGTPIYALTRVQLLKNADQLEKGINATQKTIHFYNELASRLGANTQVKDGITPEEYHKIKESVFGGGI